MDRSFSTTVVHPAALADGFTHASIVILVRWRLLLSLTLTMLLVPLNDRPLPYLPVVHVALASVPVFKLPEESAVVVPVPSSKPYEATGTAAGMETLIPGPGVSMRTLSSVARLRILDVPLPVGAQL